MINKVILKLKFLALSERSQTNEDMRKNLNTLLVEV